MEAQDAMTATPGDLRAVQYFPVLGPAADAFDDAREGRSLEALGNATLAVANGFLTGAGAGVARAVVKGVANNVGKRTGEAVRKQLRRRGVAGAGEEIHHTFPLNGIKRTEENWRNHPAFLKVLPTAQHRRQTGSWEGKPRYSFGQALWVGTPTWMKTVPAGVTGRVGGLVVSPQRTSVDMRQRPPAPYGERPLR